jgi:PKD repeat protein
LDQFNCTSRDTITVTQTTQTIAASFLIPSVVNRGDAVQFVMLTEPAPSYKRWIFGDGGSSLQDNPSYRYFQTGEFLPKLIVSNGVCSDTLTKTISVTNTRTENEPQVSLPELLDILTATSYPNPCRGILNVNIALTAEAKLWLGLFTMKGVLLAQQDELMKEKEYVFDITDQADGVFVIRIVVAGRSRVIKVIKTGGR